MNLSRASWIDTLRAVGIFLVVAGHSSLPEEARRWLRSFNMPLFLLISGFLLAPGTMDLSPAKFFATKILPLAKLYLNFALLGAAVYLFIFRNEFPLNTMLQSRAISIVYATGSTNSAADLYPVVLWYFPCLIVGRLTTYAAWRCPTAQLKSLCFAGLFVLALSIRRYPLPWEIDSAFVASSFLAIGHAARLKRIDLYVARLGHWHWPLAAVLLGVGTCLALLNVNYFDLRELKFGNPFLAVPAIVMLSLGMPLLSMKIPPSRIARTVAAATVLIFPVHMLLFPYIDRVARKMDFPTEDIHWYGWVKALFAVCILAGIHWGYRVSKRHIKAKFREAPQAAA